MGKSWRGEKGDRKNRWERKNNGKDKWLKEKPSYLKRNDRDKGGQGKDGVR